VVNDLDSIYEPKVPKYLKKPNFNYEENAQVKCFVDNRGNEYWVCWNISQNYLQW